MIKLARTRTRDGHARHDARVGILHVGTQDNGEGWWNWWVATAEQGEAAGEVGVIRSGGAPSLRVARELITTECQSIATAIREAL